MRNFIHRKLRTALQNFQESSDEVGELCVCKSLTYEGGNSPDYNDALLQHYYMLRFFPAYLAEYYLMYKHMLDQDFLNDQLKVLSIGSGCGVDLWGLYYAVREAEGDPNASINYTGVDLANWQYRERLGMANVWFLNQDITEWTELDENDYNVFVFPKCIGEFPNDVFDSICHIFENTDFSEDRICGLCSLMDQGKDADAERFRRIAQIMQNTHDYRCLDEVNNYWNYPGNRGINTICGYFDYPNDIKDSVTTIITNCANYLQNDHACEADCNYKLTRWPILTTSYINYKLIRFER